MAGDRTAIVAGGEGRNTPAAAHVASLALAGRASVASSLHRAARLAAGSEHADGLAYPWHRRPPTTLAALRAALADRYAVATANASVNAIRGALRAAWLSGDMDRAMLERSLAALRQVRGNAAPGRALSPVEVRELFEAAAGDRNHAAGARDAALLALAYGGGAPEGGVGRRPAGRPGRRRARSSRQGPPGAVRLPRGEWMRRRRVRLDRGPGDGGRAALPAREQGGEGDRRRNEPPGHREAGAGARGSCRAREGVAAHAPAQLRHVAALRRERSLRYRRPDGPRPDGHHPALRPPGRVRKARRRVHDFRFPTSRPGAQRASELELGVVRPRLLPGFR